MSDLLIQDGQLFLFQGDSITDCGRRGANAPLGAGYASIFREMVIARQPDRNVRFINKGIGGDKTVGLRDRWEDDVIRHRPDWLSVLIGINDLHTFLRQGDPYVTVDLYRECYDYILSATKEQTDAKIILLDPFYLSRDMTGHSFRTTVLQTIPDYIAVVHEMVEKYGAYHIELHDMFQEHLKLREADQFCPEPVHPNHTGHLLIANAMIDALTVG